MKITPPNFGYVEERIFRCGSPEPRHYGFLASLNLRTCILLTDDPDEAFVRWLQENNIIICCPIQPPQRGDSESKPQRSSGEPTTTPFMSPMNAAMPSTEVPPPESSAPLTDHQLPDTLGPSTSFSPSVNQSFYQGKSANDVSHTATTASSNVARFLRENTTEDTRHMTYSSPVTSLVPQRWNGELGPVIYTTGLSNRHRGLMTLSEPIVVAILHILLDPQFYPLLITCSMGRYRTGIVCGCLRKLQGWCLVSIIEEYRRFAGDKSRAENEEFIELFDKDLVSLELEGGRSPTILYY